MPSAADKIAVQLPTDTNPDLAAITLPPGSYVVPNDKPVIIRPDAN